MTDAEVAKLAAGLTRAQRDAFVVSTPIGTVTRSLNTSKALIRKGLANSFYAFPSKTLDWTPIGLAVRAYLKDHQHD